MSLKNVLGQSRAVNQLINELKTQKLKHSYIFHGIKGIGKKFTAIQFAKSILCDVKIDNVYSCDICDDCYKINTKLHPDVTIVDFDFQAELLEEKNKEQRNIKIDTIREIQRLAWLTSYSGKYKIFIIDSAETLQKEAANSLLKILEEPPKNCIFILICAGLGMLPKTIVSRSELIKFYPLSVEILQKLLPGKNSDVYYNCYGSVENIEHMENITEICKFSDLPNLSNRETQDILEKIVNDKELTKFFVYWVIENNIKKLCSEKNYPVLMSQIDRYFTYCSNLRYNIDTRLLLETILTEHKILWNKN